MVATMIAIALAVVGFDSSTLSLSRYQTPLSTKNVVPPTIANFSSSRCLISTDRSGSGVRWSTVSTTVTPGSLGEPAVKAWSGGCVAVNVRIVRAGGLDLPQPGRFLREHPLLERPPAERRAEQGADHDAADEVGDLDAERAQVRLLQVQHVPRDQLRQRVQHQRDPADQEEQ